MDVKCHNCSQLYTCIDSKYQGLCPECEKRFREEMYEKMIVQQLRTVGRKRTREPKPKVVRVIPVLDSEALYEKMLAWQKPKRKNGGRKKGKKLLHLRLTRKQILERYRKKYGAKIVSMLLKWQPRNGKPLRVVAEKLGMTHQGVRYLIDRLHGGRKVYSHQQIYNLARQALNLE